MWEAKYVMLYDCLGVKSESWNACSRRKAVM